MTSLRQCPRSPLPFYFVTSHLCSEAGRHLAGDSICAGLGFEGIQSKHQPAFEKLNSKDETALRISSIRISSFEDSWTHIERFKKSYKQREENMYTNIPRRTRRRAPADIQTDHYIN